MFAKGWSLRDRLRHLGMDYNSIPSRKDRHEAEPKKSRVALWSRVESRGRFAGFALSGDGKSERNDWDEIKAN